MTTKSNIIAVTRDGDVLITVSNRRVRAGVAGQRSVLIDVLYEGPDWTDTATHELVHSVYGGPVIAVMTNGAQIFVTDPSRYGDTSKLDADWIKNYYDRRTLR